MPKAFYTERDIEDMVKRGILSLEINDNVVLTNNAYEKANALGMQLLRDKPDVPPNAPIRPYISKIPTSPAARAEPALPSPTLSPQPPQPNGNGALAARALTAGATAVGAPAAGSQTTGAELRQRIHQAVIAKLGDKIDPKLLDIILTRVFQNTGIK